MASEAKRPDILIFRDDQGHYYAISQETLEPWRVPEELKDTATALTSESEVTGHTTPRFQVVQFKSLESQDRMGNFEIQRLMSSYNQAETLASSVRKKHDDTASGIVGKF
jgi:hypothetical protein